MIGSKLGLKSIFMAEKEPRRHKAVRLQLELKGRAFREKRALNAIEIRRFVELGKAIERLDKEFFHDNRRILKRYTRVSSKFLHCFTTGNRRKRKRTRC